MAVNGAAHMREPSSYVGEPADILKKAVALRPSEISLAGSFSTAPAAPFPEPTSTACFEDTLQDTQLECEADEDTELLSGTLSEISESISADQNGQTHTSQSPLEESKGSETAKQPPVGNQDQAATQPMAKTFEEKAPGYEEIKDESMPNQKDHEKTHEPSTANKSHMGTSQEAKEGNAPDQKDDEKTNEPSTANKSHVGASQEAKDGSMPDQKDNEKTNEPSTANKSHVGASQEQPEQEIKQTAVPKPIVKEEQDSSGRPQRSILTPRTLRYSPAAMASGKGTYLEARNRGRKILHQWSQTRSHKCKSEPSPMDESNDEPNDEPKDEPNDEPSDKHSDEHNDEHSDEHSDELGDADEPNSPSPQDEANRELQSPSRPSFMDDLAPISLKEQTRLAGARKAADEEAGF